MKKSVDFIGVGTGPFNLSIAALSHQIEELNCLCQLVEYLPESVQNNTGALLKEYGSVENVYKHFAKNQNPVL